MSIVDLLDDLLRLAAAAGLGLLMGALLAEGALLVPHWRTLAAAEFFALHKQWGPRLYRFFAPLTMAATISASMAAVVSTLVGRPGKWMELFAGILAVALVGIYFAYFQGGNARLAKGTMTAEELAAELARWTQWHWTRVAIGVVAFVFSLLGLLGWC